MRYEEWEPYYLAILEDFGYSMEADVAAAKMLAQLMFRSIPCNDDCLNGMIKGEVTVCGDAPSLIKDLREVGTVGTVMAADGATTRLMEAGIVPDIIMTDLDGEAAPQISANAQGAIIVAHAHGDNVPALRSCIPLFTGRLVASTQAPPFGNVRNYGGFTDGDRAVMVARHFGAKRILLLGFDFLEPREKSGRDRAIKVRKLEWARHLIFDLNPPGTCLSIP